MCKLSILHKRKIDLTLGYFSTINRNAEKLILCLLIPISGFPHFHYILGANLGSLFHGDVSVIGANLCKFESWFLLDNLNNLHPTHFSTPSIFQKLLQNNIWRKQQQNNVYHTDYRILLSMSMKCHNQINEAAQQVPQLNDPEREVRGSKPTAAVLCPWARHFTPRKYWLITQEAVASSRHDWKIVDWDVKPQHKQTNN